MNIEIPAGRNLQPGDNVTLAMSGAYLLQASLLAYGIPLAGALLLISCGLLFWSPLTDAAGIFLGLAGLASGFLLSRRYLRRMSCMQRFVPTVSDRYDAA
jgi:positive regulator of sigma E activity